MMPNDVILVVGSGAGGGLVSWAFTIMTGGTFGVSTLAALPLCIILGIAAALVAVYVITPTDVTKTGKLIGFALFCGFLWKPVLDAARVVINEHVQVAKTSDDVSKHLTELRAVTAQTAATPVAPTPIREAIGDKAQEAASGVATLLRSSDNLGSAKIDENANQQATEAVQAIVQTATVNPEAATKALEVIREAATDADHDSVAKLATAGMVQIQNAGPPIGMTTTTSDTTTTAPNPNE
jgi:F0F1-type ATP synthase membrane subunit b/b'